MPHPANGVDIRVTLGEMTAKLSEDALYLRLQRPKGILRWDVEVPGKTLGEKAFTLEYGYSLEFDRKYALTTPGEAGSPAAAKEFDRMLRDLEKR